MKWKLHNINVSTGLIIIIRPIFLNILYCVSIFFLGIALYEIICPYFAHVTLLSTSILLEVLQKYLLIDCLMSLHSQTIIKVTLKRTIKCYNIGNTDTIITQHTTYHDYDH